MDILVVEDEESLRDSLCEGLSAALDGLCVEGVTSVEEAVPLLRKKVSPRLIISDVRLPGNDGIDLLLFAQENWPGIPFILMSAYASTEARKEANGRGIQFLNKPFEFSELIKAVKTAIEVEEFNGKLGGIELIDLLQVLNMGRRSSKIIVSRGAEEGTIFFLNGEVVHAAVNNKVGREAFACLVGWKGGSFDSARGEKPPEYTIDQPFNSLLLDTFRVQDERGTSEEESLEFDLDFEASSHMDGPDSAAASPVRSCSLLEDLVCLLPGCEAAATVDLKSQAILDLTPADVIPDAIAAQVPTACAALLDGGPLAELDRSLASTPSQIREVILLSPDMVHFFQRSPSEPQTWLVTVSRAASANLGTIVAKARAWFRVSGRDLG